MDSGAADAGDGEPHVIVSIPHHGPSTYLRQCVTSILEQTHRNLTCVVVLDGDEAATEVLDGIVDDRLVVFTLPTNRGRYFADQVVLEATSASGGVLLADYLVVQDSDDWSEPDRIERLLHRLRDEDATLCVSDHLQHDEIRGATPPRRVRPTGLGQPASDRLFHRAGHQGLYRVEALRSLGGFGGHDRIGFDTVLVNFFVLADLTIAWEPRTLYHRRIRPGSLTTATDTGLRSAERQRLRREYAELLRRSWRETRAVASAGRPDVIRRIVEERAGEERRASIAVLAAELAARLRTSTMMDAAEPPSAEEP